MRLDGAVKRRLVEAARRAPSAHNTQPAFWRFLDGGIRLLEAPGRSLPVGDPSGRDQRMALGAAWEAMRLACGAEGLALEEPSFAIPGAVAEGRLSGESGADPLAAHLAARFSYRGQFLPLGDAGREALRRRVGSMEGFTLMEGASNLAAVAGLYDKTARHFLGQKAWRLELLKWLRFSPADPNWGRDGLNAEAMALARGEARVASVLFKPAFFAVLRTCRMTGLLASESAQTRSAAGLVAVRGVDGEGDFSAGRRLLRFWLSLEAEGLKLCPMSALADEPGATRQVLLSFGLPESDRLLTVLRVGAAPQGAVRQTPRLPPEELSGDLG